ncbi:MAG: ATP-binding protein, partial [Candidatus Margulisiibacteriota bacterium]
VRSRAERMSNRPEDKEFIIESSELTVKNIDRILNISEKMMEFAKGGKAEQGRVNLNKTLDETLLLLNQRFQDNSVAIDKRYSEEFTVKGNRDTLSEAFLNIILNSLEAMPKGGTISLSIEKSSMADTTGAELPAVKIEIADTGEGIAREKIHQIFDPFFTTKHLGTGLGLSITHKIICQDHGGYVDVKSDLGKGTSFCVWLPL